MEASLNKTQDLRAPTHDFKRDTDSRRKWEHGEEHTKGRATSHGRPGKNRFAAKIEEKHPTEWNIARAGKFLKRDIRLDAAEATDSSADEGIDEVPSNDYDADVTYSYDAHRGPSHGSQVLGYALSKAVENFENKETDKLVKNEYEVVDSEGEIILGKHAKSVSTATKQTIVLDEDEDYELI